MKRGGSWEPSIPAAESRKWPPIMRAIVEPYLMTRVLKWNKSAIKKRALAIENLLMREAVRGGPKRDETMEHGGAPLIAFWPRFLFLTLGEDDRCWQEMATYSQTWTHTKNYTDTSANTWQYVQPRDLFLPFWSHKQPIMAMVTSSVTHQRHCPRVVGDQVPSMLHRFHSHYLGC